MLLLVALGTLARAGADAPIVAGERLSDWLLRSQHSTLWAGSGEVAWLSASERPVQADLKRQLLADLRSSAPAGAGGARETLASWLAELPVTGRVPLAIGDARWLQVHPAEDPQLAADDAVTVQAPAGILVLSDDARACQVEWEPERHALHYLALCLRDGASQVDRVWVVQPDGHVQESGVASWNQEDQDPPAPGAVLWAPARGAAIPALTSRRLARFLATQVPAPGLASGLPPVMPAGESVALLEQFPEPAPWHRTVDDWGHTGLLQLPSARMAPEGMVTASLSHVYPYDRVNILLQPFEWLEAGFRYTSIQNKLYGPAALSGSQAYKHKSADVKIRLAEETAGRPQLALGLMDLAGTGLFSSEYLVASQRRGEWDATLGLAWGYLAGRQELRNPLALLSRSLATRPDTLANSGLGGTVSTKSFFRGPVSLLAGLEYQPARLPDWSFKAELDGNNYRHEPFGNVVPARTPLNIGVVYRASPIAEVSLAFERGNQVSASLELNDDIGHLWVPKVSDPPEIRFQREPPAVDPLWTGVAAQLEAQTGWEVDSIRGSGSTLRVVFESVEALPYWGPRVDRALRVLHAASGPGWQRFALCFRNRGLPLREIVVARASWSASQDHRQATLRADWQSTVEPAASDDGEELFRSGKGAWRVGLEPASHFLFGGPDNFLLYEVGLSAPFSWSWSDHTWLSGAVNARALDNYSLFKYDAPSELPRVRTDVRSYLTTSRFTLPDLQLNHVAPLGQDQFVLAYAGVLEPMFDGVGGEWMWRPWNGHFAFGLDVNRVRQRGFDQRLDLRPYSVTTGHATTYWDTGWEHVVASLAVGRYLAGDVGATLDLRRRFDSGVEMGMYFTRTSASAAQYGEGSFDKGVVVNVPFDAMLPRSSGSAARFLWEPLLRDGGARLSRATTLFDLTSGRDQSVGSIGPASPPRWDLADDGKELQTLPASPWHDFGASARDLGARVAALPAVTWERAAAWIGLSAVLDRPVADAVARHRSPKWDALGRLATDVPYALAAATALAATGTGDQVLDRTGWTAVKSAGLAYGADLALKFAFDRQRPAAGQGTYAFRGPAGGGAANSSFPSDHVAVAFALATPFAEEYAAPGLYELAAITALGRIESGQHFVSDTVAGALVGNLVGSLMHARQAGADPLDPEVRMSLGTDRSVQLRWSLP